MATMTWKGGTGSPALASTANNWDPTVVPGASDIAVFDHNATTDCRWDITSIGTIKCIMDSASNNDPTTYAFVDEAGEPRTIEFSGTIAIKELHVNCRLDANGTVVLNFPGTTTLDDARPVIFGNIGIDGEGGGHWVGRAERQATTWNFTTTTAHTKFDNGSYPNVTLTATGSGTYNPQHCAFESTYQSVENLNPEVQFLNLTVNNGANMAPTRITTPRLDKKKIFSVGSEKNFLGQPAYIPGTFVCQNPTFYAGLSTWKFYPTTSGIALPVNGSYTHYGSSSLPAASFTSKFYNIEVMSGATAGDYAWINDGCALHCNSLKVGVGALLRNHPTVNLGSEIHLTNRPIIDGSWAYTQSSDGVYRVDPNKPLLTAPYGGTGNNAIVTGGSILYGSNQNEYSQLAIGTAGQVLTVNSGATAPEWAAASGGGGGSVRTVTVDTDGDGSADNTLGSSETLMLKKGTNITLAESAGVVTISSTDTNTQLSSEQVQDIVGAMFSGNTETNITATYQDSDGTIDLVSTDTNTQLTQEQVEDFAGALVATGGTKTGIAVTYDDANGNMDFVCSAITEADQLVNAGSPAISATTTMAIVSGPITAVLPAPTALHYLRIHSDAGCVLDAAPNGKAVNLVGTQINLLAPGCGVDLFYIPDMNSWFIAAAYDPPVQASVVVA